MPNAPKTPLQNVRCEKELWLAAKTRLEAAGTNNSAAVRGFLTVIVGAGETELAEILKTIPPQ